MYEYDWCGQELERSLFKNINLWEKESIIKIQITAENVRANLRQIIDKSNDQFFKKYHDMIISLRLSSESNDYFDNKLNQWMEQLKKLQIEILSSLSVNIIEHKQSLNIDNIRKSIVQDRFSKVIGNAIIKEGGLLVKHTNEDWNYEYILGERLYSEGRHTIQFKIEQNGTPYNIFFGCISSQAIQSRISIKSSFTIGWFGSNQVYQHGIHNDNPNLHGYNSNEFATNDRLYLTFDCEKKQIELFHEDTNKTHILRVNLIKASFPWQLLIVLTDRDDCIRIIPINELDSTKNIQSNLFIE